MRVTSLILLSAICIAVEAAVPKNPQRIIGGSAATISQYPSIAALLTSSDLSTYIQTCGGSILNQRNILTAAQCVYGDPVYKWRVRVGSTYANSGGVVHNSDSIIVHNNFDPWTMDSDVAIIRTATYIAYLNNAVQAGSIAGSNYILGDDQIVWAAGWGTNSVGGSSSEQLQHVQIWTVNQSVCIQRYTYLNWPVTTNMVCTGWLDNGGRDQCEGDTGGPLYHNGVIVGVYSWGYQCAHDYYPSVNSRVSSFTSWIQANA